MLLKYWLYVYLLSLIDAVKLLVASPTGLPGGLQAFYEQPINTLYFFLDYDAYNMNYQDSLLSGIFSGGQVRYLWADPCTHIVSFSNCSATRVTVSSNKSVSFNGSPSGLYAQHNTGDPSQYSFNRYQVMYYPLGGAPAGAIPITLKISL